MRRALLFAWALAGCVHTPTGHTDRGFQPIAGFPDDVNQALARFFVDTAAHPGRKVAVFDGDGTVLGQVPHYLADECLYQHAKDHPDRRSELIAAMVHRSNVSLPYVQDRVRYLAGMTLAELRDLGRACYRRDFPGKVFAPMKALVRALEAHGFEIWIVSASPEALYQGFLSDELGLHPTRIVGVRSVIQDGVVTDEIVPPVPQDAGKKAAIETFVQERPLLVAGNSRGDREMIAYAARLSLMVNPDEHVEAGEQESVADVARRQGWLVVRIADQAAPGFKAIASRVFGVRENRPQPGPR